MGHKIAIIMGSQSDLEVMEKASSLLKEFDVEYDVKVISAHRNLEGLQDYVGQAEKENVSAFIAGAGLSAHLPGVIAAMTQIPVVGVPISCAPLNGMDSLLSIVQMPKGVPVATVGINNSTNAALFCLKILAITNTKIKGKLDQYKENLKNR
jgi:phosphoribosylaminoimidazole carboxylase PurE protein